MEQAEPVEATTQEKISDLTDKLEQPPTAPTRDVNTFWDRLDSLLENLEQTRDAKKSDVVHSFTNQPERVCISSDNDISTTQAQFGIQEESYSSFRVAILRPFLDVKSIQLLRASIPNAVTNIPNDECTFWYYRLPLCYSGTISITGRYTLASYTTNGIITGSTDTINFDLGTINSNVGTIIGYYNIADAYGGSAIIYSNPSFTTSIGTINVVTASIIQQQPSTSNLYMNRLLPSYYKEELFSFTGYNQAQNPYTTYGFNRTFGSYQDLLTELQKCSLRDPAYDCNDGAAINGPFLMRNLFIPGDITFSFNEQINKFRMTGNNSAVQRSGSILSVRMRRYLIAGYNDPNIYIKAEQLKLLTAGTNTTPSLDFPSVPGASMGGMPFTLYKTLNLRLGFPWDGIISSIIPIANSTLNNTNRTLLNRLRPVLFNSFTSEEEEPGGLGITSPQFALTYTADAFADLVYTNTVSLYTDFVGGATYDSTNNTQLLACVPMNASNLGVTFYNTTLYCPLTKISDQIYEIEIRMLTDSGQPYQIPNSAIVSLELALTY